MNEKKAKHEAMKELLGQLAQMAGDNSLKLFNMTLQFESITNKFGVMLNYASEHEEATESMHEYITLVEAGLDSFIKENGIQ